jgi:hypothetical protein
MISWNLRIIGIVGCIGLLLFILELVRRRQLKEEYTVLWVLTGIVLLLFAAWEGLLRDVRNLIGASSEASTLYFFGLIFVVALLMHFTVRVSRLERRIVAMMQEIALLGATNHNGTRNGNGDSGAPDGPGGAPEKLHALPDAASHGGDSVAEHAAR